MRVPFFRLDHFAPLKVRPTPTPPAIYIAGNYRRELPRSVLDDVSFSFSFYFSRSRNSRATRRRARRPGSVGELGISRADGSPRTTRDFAEFYGNLRKIKQDWCYRSAAALGTVPFYVFSASAVIIRTRTTANLIRIFKRRVGGIYLH